jgi:anti-sigma factor RsiW
MSELNGETGGIDRVDCGQLVDMAAELALGVLTGRDRAAALAHLDGCPACGEYVRELTETGEELLGLLPPHEPPAGFESRVLERIGLPVPSGESRRSAAETQTGEARVLPLRPKKPEGAGGRRLGTRRVGARTLAAAAVVGGVLAGGLGGWGLNSALTNPPSASPVAGPALRTATLLTADHEAAGEVFVHDSGPQWMYANVDLDNAKTTTVTCQLVTADGKLMTVGSFRLTDGYGFWGGPWTSTAKVTGARLVTQNGTVLASATFG